MTTLDLGTLNVRMKADRDRLKADLAAGERDVKDSGDRMGSSVLATALRWAINTARGWTDAGTRAGDSFGRSADGRLRDQRGRFVAAGEALGRAVGQGAGSGFQLLSTGLGNLATGAVNLTTNFWNLVPALAVLAALMIAVVPVTYLLGGAFLSLSALTTGALAAISVLGLSFMGLSDAFKKTSSAGGSVVDRARQIAMAERRVADANREVLASQLALNKARQQAAERMSDLTRNLNGARIDEADALAAVADARRDLERAREGDNPDQIDAATRAYARAQHQLAEVQDRVGDLQEEQAEASAKGVEGSDEVTAALDRQRKATEGVTDAAYDLKRAQKPPPGGGAADEATKIAASAMSAVAAIKRLKGEFEELRLGVQERFFAGVDTEITSLWGAWLPTLKTRLGSMADMFNGLFKSWAATSRKPEFIANIAAGWEHVERLIDRVGKAVVGPGLEAFGKLSRAAGPFLDAMGDKFGEMVESFSAWIDKGEKSGALQKFFEDAGQFFRDTMDIGGDVVRIIGSIISIITGGSERTRNSSMDTFVANMDLLADWFEDPKNQETIEGWFKKFEDFLIWVKDEAIPTIGKWIAKIDEWATRIGGWIDRFTAFKNAVTGGIDSITGAITGMPGRIGAAALGMWDGLKNSFRSSMNWIIGKWNGLKFTLPQTTFLGATIGGGELKMPQIQMLKDGGLVKATPGGRMVGVAEADEDEIVSPVAQMRQIVAEELARVQAERGPTYVEIPIYVGDEVVRVVRAEITEHDRKAKRAATAGAGTR